MAKIIEAVAGVRFGSTAPSGASETIPAQKSYTKRCLVCNVGINDSATPVVVNQTKLNSYESWQNILVRCYSPASLSRRPSYEGCSVVAEWLLFSTFERWHAENYVEGFQLDKDLLIPGNKLYGPDQCVFVSPRLNKLLLDRAANRGNLPLGVCANRKRFVSRVNKDNQSTYLGIYDTPLEAHKAWQLAKAEIIEQFPTTDPRIRKALDLRVAQLRDDHANNRITTKL